MNWQPMSEFSLEDHINAWLVAVVVDTGDFVYVEALSVGTDNYRLNNDGCKVYFSEYTDEWTCAALDWKYEDWDEVGTATHFMILEKPEQI